MGSQSFGDLSDLSGNECVGPAEVRTPVKSKVVVGELADFTDASTRATSSGASSRCRRYDMDSDFSDLSDMSDEDMCMTRARCSISNFDLKIAQDLDLGYSDAPPSHLQTGHQSATVMFDHGNMSHHTLAL